MTAFCADTAGTLAEVEESRGIDLLIHLGPHKTGTSWLQKHFFPHLGGVVFSGDFRKTHAAFLIPDFGAFTVERVREIFLPDIQRARREGKALILSDEALGGRPFHQKFFRGMAASRIRKAFPEAKILMTTREQDAVVLSMYGEYLRYGYSSTLAGFLSQETGSPNIAPLLALDFYMWDKAITFYQGVFGADHVRAAPLEWMTRDRDCLAALLGDFLGRAIDPPAELPLRTKERPALSGWARAVQRFANQFHPQDSRFLTSRSRLAPNSLAYWADRATPASARARGEQRSRAHVRRVLGDHYRASNTRFAGQTGFDLEALGYRM